MNAERKADTTGLRERLTKLSDAALSRRLTPAECDEFHQCIAALSTPHAEGMAELIAAARDVERRAGPDREPRLRAALAQLPGVK
jgi:hypothetical protein